ncbi:MAG: hypothetical protein JWP06_31 [Candidatus Saccharibacteria bacterium]|nr:hypothetical protein [Candidatus Saccharibacteria bacterium]
MLQQLASVRNDDTVVTFYVIVLRSGGQRMSGEEVTAMLVEAIRASTDDIATIRRLGDDLEKYVEALIKNKQVRATALNAIKKYKL